MAELEQEIDTPELTQREDVSADVRAAFEQHSDPALADKLKEPETSEQRTERLRDESGKFVAKDKVAAPEAAAQPTKTTDADPALANVVAPSTALDMPKTWSAEAKTEWSKLSPAVQQAVLKRESEMDAGGRQWSEQRTAYERALAPVAQIAQSYGMPVDDAIARLVGVEQRLGDRNQAPQVIAELAKAYGVDLTALVNGSPQPQPAAAQFDPNQLLQTFDQRLQQAFSDRDQMAALTRQIETFAAQPGHEHFAEVKQLMGHLMSTGQAPDMQDAYDKAIWATPAIRPQLIAAQTAPAVANPRPNPRKASVSLNGSPRGQAPVARNGNANDSVLDTVRAAFEQHAG